MISTASSFAFSIISFLWISNSFLFLIISPFNNEISLDKIEQIFDNNGADQIEFLFSANLGVEPRPLDKIISGGEMSRFMLAFKSIQNIETPSKFFRKNKGG